MKQDIIYATNPDLSFDAKQYCFTGKFDGHERTDLERYVESQGGSFVPNVSAETDYLVIGSLGTRCCSFSCCVRVVENAVELINKGAALQLIQESDFLKVLPQ